jgi:hypothetical protein
MLKECLRVNERPQQVGFYGMTNPDYWFSFAVSNWRVA